MEPSWKNRRVVSLASVLECNRAAHRVFPKESHPRVEASRGLRVGDLGREHDDRPQPSPRPRVDGLDVERRVDFEVLSVVRGMKV